MSLYSDKVMDHFVQPRNVGVIEEADYIIEAVKEVVAHLRSFSPVWRDLVSGKKEFILK